MSAPLTPQQIVQAPGRAGRSLVRPRAVGVVLAVTGLGLIAWGMWIGVTAAVVLGATLLVAWLFDAVGLLVGDPWRGTWVMRQIMPHPVQAGQPVDVWLMSGTDRPRTVRWLTASYEDYAPWQQGWVPVAQWVDADGPAQVGEHGIYRLTPPWRGEVQFGPLRLLTDSPLGLWQSRRTDQRRTEFVVWPATTPLVVPPMAAMESQSATGLGLPRPHLDDTTLREYQPGDDLHRVHWPSLARTNTLMTRAEEPSAIRRTVGAMWVRPGADYDAVDLGVGVLASWGEAMLASGQRFELSLGGVVMRQPSRAQMMEALAVISGAELGEVAAGASTAGRRAGADSAMLVAVAAADDTSLMVPTLANDGLAVVIAPPSVGVTAPSGWGLVRLDPTTDLASACLALQQGLAGRGTAVRTRTAVAR